MNYEELEVSKFIDKPIREKTIQELFKECLVDLDADVKPLDVLVYIGIDETGKRTPAITRGEISCIYAPSKAKKSFAKSLIESAFIGGNTETYTSHFVGNRRTKGYLISIDTEQGEFYATNSFRRVERVVGNRYERYLPFQMRRQSVKDRLKLIEWLIYESEYKGKIDMITIDGLADLVSNTNDIETSTELAEKLLRWSGDGIHICFILHKNPNSQKARGHLGTVSTIKAETLISIDRITDGEGNITERNTVKLSCSHSRGRDFEDFYLTVNDEGLPFTHSEQMDNIFKPQTSKELPKIESKDAFDDSVPF